MSTRKDDLFRNFFWNFNVNENEHNGERYKALVAGPRNEAPRERDMRARPEPKVRQWRRPRKSHESDMLLVRNEQ